MYYQVSYWILFWALLFILNLTSYNPIFYLIFIYTITSISFCYLFYKKTSSYNLQKFIVINLLHKLFFIIFIAYFYPIIFNYDDLNFGLILIFIYLILMISLNYNPFLIYYYYLDFYINGKTKENENYITFIDKFYDKLFIV